MSHTRPYILTVAFYSIDSFVHRIKFYGVELSSCGIMLVLKVWYFGAIGNLRCSTYVFSAVFRDSVQEQVEFFKVSFVIGQN